MGQSKTTTQIKNKLNRVINKRVFLAAIIIVSITSVLLLKANMNVTSDVNMNAIIVDGLSEDIPNPKLIKNVKQVLEYSGFNVTVIQADNLTIDTYKWILEAGFQLIIMRVHGAIIPDQNIVGLFANEVYDESLYRSERQKGLVGVGRPYIDPNRELFVIGPKFIEKYGNLEGSIVLVFSCYSGYGDSLKEAFIKAGANVYIGWDGPVDAVTNDYALENLIVKLFEQNLTVDQAVKETMDSIIFELNNKYKYVYENPIPKLVYSPTNIGNLNLYNIIVKHTGA